MNEDRFIKQYELITKSAENISTRRNSANNYFLSVNSILLLFEGFLVTQNIVIGKFLVSVIGMLISFFWIILITSYKKLNSAKFEIIHDMEKRLPLPIYTRECDILKQKGYTRFTSIERIIPFLFIIFYFSLGFLSLLI